MARLSDAAKTFIVTRLAMFDTPSQVATALREELGVEVSRQHVEKYDCDRRGEKPGRKWQAIFEETRIQFTREISRAPVTLRAVRVRRLERMAVTAEKGKNYPFAANLLRQIAKEVGGRYTNQHELTGRDGGAIETKVSSPDADLRQRMHDMTTEELANFAVELAGGLRGTGLRGEEAVP